MNLLKRFPSVKPNSKLPRFTFPRRTPAHFPESTHPTINFHVGQTADPVRTTKAINSCCKSGELKTARKLFDEMPQKNIVSFSTMIHGYAIHGFFAESLQLFSRMQESGIRPNSFTFVAILLGAAGLQGAKLGESIHGSIIKDGFLSCSYVMTALIDAYAKCGSVGASYNVFVEMDSLSLVSCNAMIAGFVLNGCFEEALLLFTRLWLFDLAPNSITLMSISQSCIAYGSFELCECVHGYLVKRGLDLDVSVLNSVLEMYLSSGNLEIGRCFFTKMVVRDVISWATMMGFLSELGCAPEALDMVCRMRLYGIEPDMVTMVHVISTCSILGDLGTGRSVHNLVILHGFELKLPVMNSLIGMYCKCGDTESARKLFNRALDKSLVSWTVMISGYVQNGYPGEGLRLFIRMRNREKFDVDSVMLVSLLAACGKLANFQLCKQFHGYGIKLGLLLSEMVQNCLVSVYGKCGHVDSAFRVFQEIISRNIVSWNAMIYSYGINSDGKATLTLLHEMDEYGENPDGFTYLNVLTACNHSGLVDDGLVIFTRMVKDRRIKPQREHFGCLVDMLARAGHLDDARKLVNSMPEEVSWNVWKALLGKSHVHGDIMLAEVAAAKVFDMDSKDSGHVVQLANAFASVGKYENVESLRTRIGRNDLVKKPGFSLLDGLPCDAAS